MLENIIKQLSAKNKKTDNIVVDNLLSIINDNFQRISHCKTQPKAYFLILHIAADF